METRPRRRVEVVVKIGGSLLAHVDILDTVLAEIAAASAEVPLLVVPGGGPFADAVRAVNGAIHLSDDAAHWMAVLAMDQYAHLVAGRLTGGCVASGREAVDATLNDGGVPVLAPYRWLREADPLPHSWEITSDSIAAWVAGRLDVPNLVLVKHPGASGRSLVDSCFARVLPRHITASVVTADRVDILGAALRRSR